MTLLATDRYRLAMREITWNPENPEIEAAVLLKAKTMTEVGRDPLKLGRAFYRTS